MPNDEPLSGATDAAGSWTIKLISAETRDTITRMARREDLTIGQWLEKRVREWMDDGSPVVVAPRPNVQQRLTLVERAIDAAARLASAENVPISFRRRANRLLREALPGPPPRATTPALPHPDDGGKDTGA